MSLEPALPSLGVLSPGDGFSDLAIGAGAATAVVDPAVLARLCAGHFPGEPMLPGAHLLGLLSDLALLAAGGADSARLVRLERCTFTGAVTPARPLSLTVRVDPAGFYRGEATIDGRRVGAARVRLEPR